MNRSILYYILFCTNITFSIYTAQPPTLPHQISSFSPNLPGCIPPNETTLRDHDLIDLVSEETQTPLGSSSDRRMSSSTTLPPETSNRRMSSSAGGTQHLAPERADAFLHNRAPDSVQQ